MVIHSETRPPANRSCRVSFWFDHNRLRQTQIVLKLKSKDESKVEKRLRAFGPGETICERRDPMQIPNFIHKLVATGFILSVCVNQTMAQQPIVAPAPTGPVIQKFLQPANFNLLRNNQVLGIPTSHCGHVINLMMANRRRQQMSRPGTSNVYLPHLSVGLTPGDLELSSVMLVCDGDSQKGPVFEIGMKNNSDVPIGNFKVSIVGVLGQIHVHSPTVTVPIRRMEAGEQSLIQIQLPVTCMSMGLVSQQSAFDTLIVALDSYDDLIECDELNNVQILRRLEIAHLVAPIQVAPPVADLALLESTPPPAVTVPQVPEGTTPSPLDGLDLDELELEEAKSLRLYTR
jgi:hypothetical protein